MISGILGGIAAGSTVPNFGNPTLDFLVQLPRLVIAAAAGLFATVGS